MRRSEKTMTPLPAPLHNATARFDAAAATWDTNPVRAALTAAVAAALRASVPLRPDMAVLEYGCGTAALSLLLADAVGRITAADTSEGMLQEVGRKLAAAGIDKIQPLRLDLTVDALPADRFDLVASSMTLHHIIDTRTVLAQLAALLKPGGWLALADLCVEDGSFHPDTAVPHHGFDPAALAELLAGLGLGGCQWRVAHRLERNGREYAVFLLTAEKGI